MLYLVLTTDSLLAPNTVLTAVLATTGIATAFEFRAASLFTLERTRDGAPFAITPHQPLPAFGGGPLVAPRDGNYALAEFAGVNALGRSSLVAGESHRIRVVTEGRNITGVTTIPTHPSPSFTKVGDSIRVAWPKVANSPLYFVQGGEVGPSGFTIDTSVVIAARSTDINQTAVTICISAVDQNYGDFILESRTVSGLSGAYGLFGAISSTDTVIPLVFRRGNTRTSR